MTMLDSEKFYNQTFCEMNYFQEKISGKEFDGCHFQSCDFSEATFLNCEFSECKFTDCNLSIVNVNNSKFLDVDFIDCKVIGINWVKADWHGLALGSPLTFKKCMMNSSSFYGLSLEKTVIKDCRAHDVDFGEANFSGASFSGSDLTNSIFHKTNLTGANFNGAENYDINIKNNVIKNAKFCRYEAVRLLEPLGIILTD
ncbi:MAG: pentapeptide repeat-containing protein [Thalassotalea sp.]|nr:pentapeptide repeat-containing protein [Thalassotalea sp.]